MFFPKNKSFLFEEYLFTDNFFDKSERDWENFFLGSSICSECFDTLSNLTTPSGTTIQIY